MTDNTRTIQVEALARVEGEGRFKVRLEGGKVVRSEFSIFEPPRYFEGLLRGRSFRDAPDVTSRICGICPIAYIMGASQAMEDALGWQITRPIADLRRLIYCGEWIQSHVLHTHMLHAPDFLGLPDSIALAQSNRSLVENGLAAKKMGNRLMEVIGGRSVHPVNTRVGGFYAAPAAAEIHALVPELERCEALSVTALDAFSGFDFPDLEVDYLFVALRHESEYPITEGRIVSSAGLDIPVEAFPEHFEEHQVPHSNALQGATVDGRPYLVGPLARFNLNADRLPADILALAERAGLAPGCRNPFKSLLARQVETIYAFREAARLARDYVPPAPSFVEEPPRAGTGHGITEAPRGICYHRYEVADDGAIVSATIVPPTSQNQRQIELDLVSTVERFHELDDDDLQWRCEQAIRNYDPCISCATHFLKLDVERA
ncbi:Ni/Fe hydrogenase subunit alpha [Pelagibius sp.]|uniref:Ni/Fe hydrogenase subunit alpha n=1 Tax=Pelagibius sp. TaxID=1931238 RepID=UPI00260B1B15|nr:nickel-dependent hydrogenase large subunit [Pelagibius sp.]